MAESGFDGFAPIHKCMDSYSPAFCSGAFYPAGHCCTAGSFFVGHFRSSHSLGYLSIDGRNRASCFFRFQGRAGNFDGTQRGLFSRIFTCYACNRHNYEEKYFDLSWVGAAYDLCLRDCVYDDFVKANFCASFDSRSLAFFTMGPCKNHISKRIVEKN